MLENAILCVMSVFITCAATFQRMWWVNQAVTSPSRVCEIDGSMQCVEGVRRDAEGRNVSEANTRSEQYVFERWR